MKVKRTALADRPRAATWVQDEYGSSFAYADTLFEQDYPTHSPILGPNGRALQYEDRPRMGFDLRPKS